MADILCLKRGSGWTFDGANWNLASEKLWGIHQLLVPNGKEEHVGMRDLHGLHVAVFKLLNDGFFAQPLNICKLPIPKDPLEILYSLEPPAEAEEEKPRSKTKTIQGTKILTFSGKNWKLAADNKWKSTTAFSTFETNEKVGEKTIGQTAYYIHKVSSGFIAVKRDDE
jgi:hypothetical protein